MEEKGSQMSEDNKGIEKFNLFEAEREREIARAQQNKVGD